MDKKNKRYMLVIVGVLLVFIGVIIAAGIVAIPVLVQDYFRFVAFCFGILMFEVGIILCLYADNGGPFLKMDHNSRPIVHVWEHDHITRVMLHEDWELWYQLQERTKLAGIHNPYLRPDSEIMMLFSDSTTRYIHTGTMNQYEKLIQGCRVVKSEMQIHYNNGNVLNFLTAWELIHGKNSTPPTD
jgi:hypothetical protein